MFPFSVVDCVFPSKHVTMEDSYLCGYLKIKGLTEVSGVNPFVKDTNV